MWSRYTIEFKSTIQHNHFGNLIQRRMLYSTDWGYNIDEINFKPEIHTQKIILKSKKHYS